jgi:cytochrome P450
MRRRVANLYSMTSILTMEDKVQVILDALWARFDHFAVAGQVFDLSKWSFFLTYDALSALSLGKPLGMITSGTDVNNTVHSVHTAIYWIANMGYLPGESSWLTSWLAGKLQRVLRLEAVESVSVIEKVLKGAIVPRLFGSGDQEKDKYDRDMLDSFKELKEADGQPITIPNLMGEVGNMLAAGVDTTGVGIMAVLMPLFRDPERMQCMQTELDSFVDQDPRSISYTAAKDLPFLSACIKEGQRLHPSIVYQLPRHVPEQGLRVGEHFLDGSTTTISMSPLAMNRNREVFGEDADEYRPERWMQGRENGGSSAEEVKWMDKYLATVSTLYSCLDAH